MRFSLVLLFSLTLFISCEPTNTIDCHQKLTFINKTDRALYVQGNFYYPDTNALRYGPDPSRDPATKKVRAWEVNKRVLSAKHCIETTFREFIASDTMSIYVFDAETLENTTWEDVITNKKYYRYNLSFQDLKDRNWHIEYNGKQ